MYHSGSLTQWVTTYIAVETKCFQPRIDKVINPSKVITFKRHQEFKKVRQRKMYKIYLAFRKKRNQMTTKISAPKIPKKLQQEKIESEDWHMDVKIPVSERF